MTLTRPTETYAVFTWDTFTWGKCHFTIENVTQYKEMLIYLGQMCLV